MALHLATWALPGSAALPHFLPRVHARGLAQIREQIQNISQLEDIPAELRQCVRSVGIRDLSLNTSHTGDHVASRTVLKTHDNAADDESGTGHDAPGRDIQMTTKISPSPLTPARSIT